MGNYEPAAHHRRQRLSRPGTSGLASQFDTTRHSIVHSPILQSASILRRYSLSATDRKIEIMVGLAPAAIMVLIEEDEIAIELESPHDALGPKGWLWLRLRTGVPDAGSSIAFGCAGNR